MEKYNPKINEKKWSRQGGISLRSTDDSDKYDPGIIEGKWQKYWKENSDNFSAKNDSGKEKAFILDMFPYPSGAGLHVGHVESYTATDIYSRYLRMNGKNVLHPQGFDAFGLPAENYAIKTGIHPKETISNAVEVFKRQINSLGFSYDWSREVNSSLPEYYKWTQWLFLLFYKNGLAYKKKAKVNWCPKCQTVLANEQAENGKCERCESEVIQKDLEQWFFKITDFIEDKGKTSGLLSGLEKIDWPNSTKLLQENWIGKSEGAEVYFKFENSDEVVSVYTTRVDTIFSCTYIILAPELELVEKITTKEQKEEVDAYIKQTNSKTDLERTGTQKNKTGVFTGSFVINPATNEKIPVWISDFVLAGYGTGSVFADAHDERDFEMAKKYNIPLKVSIKPADENLWEKVKNLEECYPEDGVLVNSGQFDGLTSSEARAEITKWLEKNNSGKRAIKYKLRDWLVSRQRYWGAPIPIIYCEKCKNKKYKYLLLHGRHATSKTDFWPWLVFELEKNGHKVFYPDLPNTLDPKVEEQSNYVLKNYKLDEDTVIIGHSHGGAVALKVLEKANKKINKVIFVDSVLFPKFNDKRRIDLEENFNWKFDFKKIKNLADDFIDLADQNFPIITRDQFIERKKQLNTNLIYAQPEKEHFCGIKEPLILKYALNSGEYPVLEKDLPVELPDDVDFKPTGESPLKYSKKFQEVKCPKCGGKAKRESDTMDTFVCSSWYYLRYADSKNEKEFASKEKLEKWLPIDLYVGGAEHSVLHLLYARFFTKVLHNLGYLSFDEPFLKLRHQGTILAEDGTKMSKSKGNVVNPDDVVREFGADALRIFEMFMGPLEDAKPWQTKGIVGVRRFLEKFFDYYINYIEYKKIYPNATSGGDIKLPILHKSIKKVSKDIEEMRFNTAVSQLMILINSLRESSEKNKIEIGVGYTFFDDVKDMENILILLSPFAPHLAEELWEKLGHKESIFKEKWPAYDSELIKDEEIELIIQVNGKVRDKMKVSAEISEEEAKKIALEREKIRIHIAEKEIKKIIFVKGKLISIVA